LLLLLLVTLALLFRSRKGKWNLWQRKKQDMQFSCPITAFWTCGLQLSTVRWWWWFNSPGIHPCLPPPCPFSPLVVAWGAKRVETKLGLSSHFCYSSFSTLKIPQCWISLLCSKFPSGICEGLDLDSNIWCGQKFGSRDSSQEAFELLNGYVNVNVCMSLPLVWCVLKKKREEAPMTTTTTTSNACVMGLRSDRYTCLGV